MVETLPVEIVTVLVTHAEVFMGCGGPQGSEKQRTRRVLWEQHGSNHGDRSPDVCRRMRLASEGPGL